MGLDMAWAPHTPFSRVPLTVGVGALSDKVIAVDGKAEVGNSPLTWQFESVAKGGGGGGCWAQSWDAGAAVAVVPKARPTHSSVLCVPVVTGSPGTVVVRHH
jgi:hypothetical protein